MVKMLHYVENERSIVKIHTIGVRNYFLILHCILRYYWTVFYRLDYLSRNTVTHPGYSYDKFLAAKGNGVGETGWAKLLRTRQAG